MTDRATFKVEGLRELSQFLERELPDTLRRKAQIGGMKDAMKPMIAWAAATAPKKSGALRASIKAQTLRKRDDNFTAIVWGPRTGVMTSRSLWAAYYLPKTGSGDVILRAASDGVEGVPDGPFYAHFQEFGFYNKLIDRNIPGKHFMRNAFDMWLPYYLAELKYRIKQRADKAIRKHNKRSPATNKRNSP